MRKFLLIIFIPILCLSCSSKESRAYTSDAFKSEFKDAFNVFGIPMGTYFWDEFKELEEQYGLTKDESKLLGRWMNVTFARGPYYIYYNFFPNKFFISTLGFRFFQVNNEEKTYFDKALGTWEIIDGVVRITIYAIITEDETLERPHNKNVFFVEKPYSINFINIDDIDEQGFTLRPVNDKILSKELLRKVTVLEQNKTNNLYIRNVYGIAFITFSGNPEKNYNYFSIVPELAQDNISGLELATNLELIRKYIPDWL